MPNVTSVWDFSPGDTLTAAKLDDVNCGIHVFSGTATRDAAYGGSGERTLAEGEFAYLADTDTTQYYDGSSWQSLVPVQAQGLTLIKTQTIGSAVSSVTVSDAFSATYDNYLVTLNNGVSSTDVDLSMQMGATTTGYYGFLLFGSAGSNTVNGEGNNNIANFKYFGTGGTTILCGSAIIQNPFLSKYTMFNAHSVKPSGTYYTYGATLQNTTSYTAFTIAPNTGTLTGGTIRVYGYQNS